MDLLGAGDDDVIEPYKPEPTKPQISNNQDLLDLLCKSTGICLKNFFIACANWKCDCAVKFQHAQSLNPLHFQTLTTFFLFLGGLDVNNTDSNSVMTMPNTQNINNNNNIVNINSSSLLVDGLFSSTPPVLSSLTAYEKNGLKIIFNLEKPSDSPDTTVVSMIATNSSSSSFTEFLFQVKFIFLAENQKSEFI